MYIVATNFTTKTLKKELQKVKNKNSILEVRYENYSCVDGEWIGFITNVISHDNAFNITIAQLNDSSRDAFSVQELLDEINDESLPDFIIFCSDELKNNIEDYEFYCSDKETILYLL